jgi:hypothetical protein
MLQTIAIIFAFLLVVVVALLAYASTKPNTVRYARSARINAPPEKIAGLITDFRKWGLWSPWEKLDPNLKRSFSGKESGVGAVYGWEGNRSVGSGRMEILEASPRRVRIQLDFITPFKASNVAEFDLAPQGGATDVNWVMTAENLFVGKVMSIFLDMDRMIGKNFETGLADMKVAAERG